LKRLFYSTLSSEWIDGDSCLIVAGLLEWVPLIPRMPVTGNRGHTALEWQDYASAAQPETQPDKLISVGHSHRRVL